MRRPRSPFGVALALVACLGLLSLASCDEAPAATRYRYVIPEGTAGRMVAGGAPQIFPDSLTVRVGDSITIVNDDTEDQTVGPYEVPAGTTIRQTFVSPGVLEGVCDLSPGGAFRLRVIDPDAD